MHFWIHLYVDWPCYNPLRHSSKHYDARALHEAIVHRAFWYAQFHHWGDAVPNQSVEWTAEQKEGPRQGISRISGEVDDIVYSHDTYLQHCNAPYLIRMVAVHQVKTTGSCATS